MSRVGVFGYGSLVDLASASQTLGRAIDAAPEAALAGWSRRWSLIRHNPTCEKTFRRRNDGWIPEWILVVNIEPDEGTPNPVNGVILEVEAEDLPRLDLREFRYDRIDVSDALARSSGFDQVYTYVGKAEYQAPSPLPEETAIMATYVAAMERGFARFGEGALGRYRRSTGDRPVATMDGELIRDEIAEGNPREW